MQVTIRNVRYSIIKQSTYLNIKSVACCCKFLAWCSCYRSVACCRDWFRGDLVLTGPTLLAFEDFLNLIQESWLQRPKATQPLNLFDLHNLVEPDQVFSLVVDDFQHRRRRCLDRRAQRRWECRRAADTWDWRTLGSLKVSGL